MHYRRIEPLMHAELRHGCGSRDTSKIQLEELVEYLETQDSTLRFYSKTKLKAYLEGKVGSDISVLFEKTGRTLLEIYLLVDNMDKIGIAEFIDTDTIQKSPRKSISIMGYRMASVENIKEFFGLTTAEYYDILFKLNGNLLMLESVLTPKLTFDNYGYYSLRHLALEANISYTVLVDLAQHVKVQDQQEAIEPYLNRLHETHLVYDGRVYYSTVEIATHYNVPLEEVLKIIYTKPTETKPRYKVDSNMSRRFTADFKRLLNKKHQRVAEKV